MKALSLVGMVVLCCSLTAFAASGTFNATTNASVAPTVTPSPVTVLAGQKQQFTSSDPNVTWSIIPIDAGRLSNTGLYTAGTLPGPVTVVATDSVNQTIGQAHVTVATFAITPNPSSVVTGKTLTLTSSMPAIWAVTAGGGSITNKSIASTTATYTASKTIGTATIKATDAANHTITAKATVNITAQPTGISVSPLSANVVQGQSQQFTASGATGTVTWSVSPAGAGSISATGSFTAGAPTGPATIMAMDAGTGTGVLVTANVVALAVTPATANVVESGTQTFTANAPVVWTVSAGSVSPGSPAMSTIFTAPATTLGPITITATEMSTTGTFTAIATANVTAAPVIVSPNQATVVAGQPQQFTSSDPNVAWSVTPLGAGSVSNTGLYTAGITPGPVTVTAADSANGSSGNANVIVIAFAITPNPSSVVAGGTLILTSNAPAIWAVTAGNGSISNTSVASTTATYTAPTTPGSATVTATEAANNTITATDTVNIAALTVTPASANVVQGQPQQYTASGTTGTVTWSVSPSGAGSISASGLFTAGATTGSATITAVASGTATSATATANVVALAVTPTTANVAEGATQTFTANAPVVWTVSAGTISPSTPAASAVFTAPATVGAVTITATETSSAGTFAVLASANVSVAATVTPKQATVVAGQQQQFTSSDPNVTWSVTPPGAGAVSNTGLYTAGITPGPVTVSATDSVNGSIGNANVSVIALAITPNPLSIVAGGTLTLTANAPATWAVTTGGGSVTNTTTASTTASYTAPTTTGSATITATGAANNAITATDSVTIGALIITPSTASTVEGNTQQFTANAAVNWTTSCGTIDSTGLFTAPNVVEDCTITATEAGTEDTANVLDHVIAPTSQGLNYVTWKNDNGRTGQQRNETLITPSNVTTKFGVKFSVALDGMALAQPLYLSGLTVNGAKHNVVFVATEHDSVYAFDADTSGAALWQTSFLINGVTTVPYTNVGSTVYPEVGITGTPVIDAGTGTLYMVAETLEGGNYVHRLHALDVMTGNEQSGSPTVIAAPGFASKEELQRPALAIANGNVYIAFGSQGDTSPWNGWVMAYSESTLSQVAAWNVAPGGTDGGIWGGGGGLSADANGDIYVATGNGSFNGTTQFSMGIVKLSPSLKVLDWFAPWDAVVQSRNDKDVGSGGVLVVPDQSGAFPHELIHCGKLPQVYVLDRDNLGHQGATSDSQIVQELTNVVGGTSGTGTQPGDHCFSTPAYWEQNLYFVGNNDVIKQFTLNPATGKMSTTPTSRGSFTFIFPGAQVVTSSNGSTNGIVWAIDSATPAQLHAFDATNVSNVLYTSGPLVFERWAAPTVVDGKVFVAGSKKLFVFGLLF